MKKAIRQALEVAVNTWAAVQSPAVPMAWENVPYTPTIGTRYAQVNLLPAETQNPTLGDAHQRYIGLVQVLLCLPDGTGAGAGMTLSDSLLAYFARGESFAASGITVRILSSPSVAPALADGVWYKIPVSIYYQADVY